MVYKIGLLGLGTVGTGVVQILQSPQRRHPLLQAAVIHRIGVRSLDKPREIDLPSQSLTTDLAGIVTDPEIDIVIELMGGIEPARSLILTAIGQGKHVVTANKALIARHGEEIFAAATQAQVCVLLEAAVAGGIPVIQPLRQSLAANRIHSVMGIINGTTNFILTQMSQSQASFAAALALAQQKGFAEADPSADVEGWDAADKIAILASLAFGARIPRDQIPCEGIRQISAADIRYAQEWGYRIKLLAVAQRETGSEGLDIRVHPALVPLDHPLAAVNGVDNAVLVEGDPLGRVMLSGPGAGRGPTASAVVSDLLSIMAHLQTTALLPNELLSALPTTSIEIQPLEQLHSEYYLRLLTQDVPGVIGTIGTCFGEHQVSLELIRQTELHDGQAEIVILTHQVKEDRFRQAMSRIETLPLVVEAPTILRVLPKT